jgi:DNA-binding response OmpR family regulator
MEIFIIEDNQEVRKLYRDICEIYGQTPVIIFSEKQLIPEVTDCEYDLAVFDVHLGLDKTSEFAMKRIEAKQKIVASGSSSSDTPDDISKNLADKYGAEAVPKWFIISKLREIFETNVKTQEKKF